MTLQDIEDIPREFLKISEAAEYLQCSPQGLRVSIRRGNVPWAYMIGQATFIIPKRAFVHWHKYGMSMPENKESG
jgi:hypothetical protein